MTNQQEQLRSLFREKYKLLSAFADACGNTFLIFDALQHSFTQDTWEQVKHEIWLHLKHANVDGALVLRKIAADGNALILRMHVLEPDGTESDFCGNGARAVGKFLYCSYHESFDSFFLMSRRGKHALQLKYGDYFVEMGLPIVELRDRLFQFSNTHYHFRFVDCVEPHLVTNAFFNLELLDSIGHQINSESREQFPHGVNINCFRKVGKNLEVMTFERGVYKITAACGTGSTACCAYAIEQKIVPNCGKYRIKVIGGTLTIDAGDGKFWLGGPVLLS